MTTIKLTSADDLDLSSGGLQLLTGIDETIQRIRTKLRFVKGEWFLDQRIGMPYLRRDNVLTPIVGDKNPNLAAIRAVFARAVRNDPGVVKLDSITATFTATIRALGINWSAIIEGQDFPTDFSDEFIV